MNSFEACSYYFVDKFKNLINQLNTITLICYPGSYEKFINIVNHLTDDDFDEFEIILEETLRQLNRKNGHIFMTTVSSNYRYIDLNDERKIKYFEGFAPVLKCFEKFIDKKMPNISFDIPEISQNEFEESKIFLNQDICIRFNHKGEIQNLVELYGNIDKENRIKLNKKKDETYELLKNNYKPKR